jgi:parallel beta-helix repeat protein
MGAMTRLALVVSAVAAAGVFAGSSVAVSKAIVTCGDTISSPGIYSLAADCSGGITITSDNVTLQMMGHQMTDGGSGNGIAVLSVSHVLIKGPGTLLGYGAGVFVSESSDVRVDGLSVAFSELGTDVYESSNVAVTHDSTFFTLDGVDLDDSSGNTVESNNVQGSFDIGIDLEPGSSDNTVVDNTVTNNYYGIEVGDGATGNRIFANHAKGNFIYDLYDNNAACDSNQWRRNGFNTANQPCIH